MPGIKINCSTLFTRLMVLGLLAVPMLAQAPIAMPVQGRRMPRAEKHESRHEIDQIEDAWRNAILKSNTAALDSLLADDYMAITASGTLQTKEQALANLRSGRIRFTAIDVSERKVRFYGATALVTSLVQVQGATADGNTSGSYRYTRVYVRDARGKWKIVSFEASRIREGDERK
jgi:ketosteroid isomerase-like protein